MLNENTRIFGLDILRAAAILFILQVHSLRYIEPHANVHYYWLFLLDGVDLFFVLSGFLIGGILIRAIHDKDFTWQQLFNFWIRRWFRTLPNYFLILLILIVAYRYAFRDWPPQMIQFFFFIQSFAGPHPHFFPEAWSLAVEEWFYLLVPFGLFLALKAGKNKQKIILAGILTVLTGITIFRIYKAYSHHYLEDGSWDSNIRKQVLTRLDSIMYGFLGAWLNHYHNSRWIKRKNLLFATGLILLFGSRIAGAYNDGYYQYFYISVQSAGTLLLLPKLNSIRSGKGFIYRALTFISMISYSMYLLNYTIVSKIILPYTLQAIGLTDEKSFANNLLSLFLFWSLTIFLSRLLYKFFERPMMNLRDRFRIKKNNGLSL